MVISSQMILDSEIKRFEASLLSDNKSEVDEAVERCHEALDEHLSSKQALFVETLESLEGSTS